MAMPRAAPAMPPLPWIGPLYFAAYFASLFVTLETEWAHWATLVLAPLALSAAAMRWTGAPVTASAVAAGYGLRRGHLRDGLLLAVATGVALGVLQLLVSRQRDAFVELIRSGRAFLLLPITLTLMIATAATTEEFFFRGFLQPRLEAITSSRVAGLVLASVLFGLYHLPYAYLNPHWPSAGHWGAAWSAAMSQGVLGGLILGGVFLASGRNLVASIVVHACINAFPAMTLVHFG